MKEFLGVIMMFFGLLIAVTSGICSGYVVVGILGTPDYSALIMPLIFGGLPFMSGLSLILKGKRLLSEQPKDTDTRG